MQGSICWKVPSLPVAVGEFVHVGLEKNMGSVKRGVKCEGKREKLENWSENGSLKGKINAKRGWGKKAKSVHWEYLLMYDWKGIIMSGTTSRIINTYGKKKNLMKIQLGPRLLSLAYQGRESHLAGAKSCPDWSWPGQRSGQPPSPSYPALQQAGQQDGPTGRRNTVRRMSKACMSDAAPECISVSTLLDQRAYRTRICQAWAYLARTWTRAAAVRSY
jgi:hypothetical protein